MNRFSRFATMQQFAFSKKPPNLVPNLFLLYWRNMPQGPCRKEGEDNGPINVPIVTENGITTKIRFFLCGPDNGVPVSKCKWQIVSDWEGLKIHRANLKCEGGWRNSVPMQLCIKVKRRTMPDRIHTTVPSAFEFQISRKTLHELSSLVVMIGMGGTDWMKWAWVVERWEEGAPSSVEERQGGWESWSFSVVGKVEGTCEEPLPCRWY